MLAWLTMGPYSTYIWSAYGLAVFLLLGNVWLTQRQQKRLNQQLKRWIRQQSL